MSRLLNQELMWKLQVGLMGCRNGVVVRECHRWTVSDWMNVSQGSGVCQAEAMLRSSTVSFGNM